jgi:GAF domain-containing protein/HAMP domain-containing protein
METAMKWFKNLGLSFKLNLVVILTLGAMLVVLILVTGTLDDFTTLSGQHQVERETEVIHRRFAEVEQEMLANTRTLATTPGLAEAVANKDQDAVRTTLLVGASKFNFDDIMDVVDAEGNPVFVEIAASTAENSQLDALRTLALIGSVDIDLIVAEGPEPKLRLVAVAPIRDTTSGQIVGGLLTSRDVDNEFMAEVNLDRENVHIVSIVENRVLPNTFSSYGSEEHLEIEEFSSVLHDPTAIGQALNGQTVIAEDIVLAKDGSPHVMAFMPLSVGGEIKSVIGVMVELEEQLAFQRQFITNSSLIYVFLAVAAVVIIAVFAIRSISIPINKLRVAAEQMKSGDYGQRARVTSGDEIGQLADSFNSMAAQLQELIDSLEERVAQRTQRLETVAAFSERLLAILNLDELLEQIVNQIQQNFGYYYAHIYLLDETTDQLVMAAGTGRAGAQMKASGHHIMLNAPVSLVARAVRTGQPLLINDVRETPDWLPNPLLPDTLSEMAVPIMFGTEEQVVGVLDVQQDEVAGLDEGDVALLRSLANQVAVAIRNARLFAQVETALAEARAAQERYVEQSWQPTRISATGGQYHYVRPDAPVLDEAILVEAKQHDLPSARPVILNENSGTGQKSIAATITVRDNAVGALRVFPAGNDRQWTEDELAIVEAVVDQLAQSAESLRLFEETRQRAGREQTIRQVTERMRSATNLDELVRIAAKELGQHFSAKYASIKLGIDTSVEDSNR